MNKDFNVYKWRREHLNEEYRVRDEGFHDSYKRDTTSMYDPKTGKYVNREYDGYYSVITTNDYFDSALSYNTFGDEIISKIEDKTYTFVGNSAAEGRSFQYKHFFYYIK